MTDYEDYDVASPNEVRADEEVEAYESTAEEEIVEPEGQPETTKGTLFPQGAEDGGGRVTEKPETDTVEFTVLREFTWHGNVFEAGENELPQDEYEAMLYDINLRQDRVRLVL